jgi:hypothetical protein
MKCRYCGGKIAPNDNKGKDTVTGEYFHIECFTDSEPEGRAIAARAAKLANAVLKEREMKKSLH